MTPCRRCSRPCSGRKARRRSPDGTRGRRLVPPRPADPRPPCPGGRDRRLRRRSRRCSCWMRRSCTAASLHRIGPGSCSGAVRSLAEALEARGSRLTVRIGRPGDVVPAFAAEVGASEVLVSRDYTPFGRARDRRGRRAAGCAGHRVPCPCRRAGPRARAGPDRRRSPVHAVRAVPSSLGCPAVPSDGARASGHPDRARPCWRSRAAPSRPRRTSACRHRPPIRRSCRCPANRPRGRAWMRGWTRARRAGVAAYAATRDQLFNAEGTSRLGPDLRFGLLSPRRGGVRGHGPRTRAAPVPNASSRNSPGATSTPTACGTNPRLAREPHASRLAEPGLAGRRRRWTSGGPVGPAIPSSMRRCASSSRPARCRTAPG